MHEPRYLRAALPNSPVMLVFHDHERDDGTPYFACCWYSDHGSRHNDTIYQEYIVNGAFFWCDEDGNRIEGKEVST